MFATDKARPRTVGLTAATSRSVVKRRGGYEGGKSDGGKGPRHPGETTTAEFMNRMAADHHGKRQPDLKTKLLTSYKAGNRNYEKIHLDGYDQSDVITGKGATKRKEFYYFTETTLHGVRYGDWKFLFKK
ncbi:MAG: hypothetical protein U5J82_03935 [Desulfobacterales bacterium]|nr:hypothetical protein [Desulfobacterales bacterium]